MARDKEEKKSKSAAPVVQSRQRGPQKGSLWAHRLPAAVRSAKKMDTILKLSDARKDRLAAQREANPPRESKPEASFTPRHQPGYDGAKKREAKKRTYKATATGRVPSDVAAKGNVPKAKEPTYRSDPGKTSDTAWLLD